MSYVYEDYGTKKARDIARQYKDQYGQLIKVICSPDPKTIKLIYANGIELLGQCQDGYFMQFGYMGSGTSNFWAFLSENGFKISYDNLIEMSTPETILPETTQLSELHVKYIAFKCQSCGQDNHTDHTSPYLQDVFGFGRFRYLVYSFFRSFRSEWWWCSND